MAEFTTSEKEIGKARFQELFCPLSRVAKGKIKDRLKRLDRRNKTNHRYDDELIYLADKYARRPGFLVEQSQVIRNLESPDGMPFSRRQADFSALTEQMQFYLSEDKPNRWYHDDYRYAVETLLSWVSDFNLEPYPCNTEEDCDKLVSNKNAITGWYAIEHDLAKDKKEVLKGRFKELRDAEVQRIYKEGTCSYPIIWIGKVDATPDVENNTFTRKLRGVNPIDVRTSLVAAPYAKAVDDAIHQIGIFGPGFNLHELSEQMVFLRLTSNAIIEADYSKFDSTQPAWCLRDVFMIFKAMFKPGTVDEKIWSALVESFINKTFLTYDGKDMLAFDVKHGNISGHDFTTAVNCIVNLLIWLTVSKHFDLEIQGSITGDDSVIGVKNKIGEELDTREIGDFVTNMFGIRLKPEKVVVRSNPKMEYIEYLSSIQTPMGQARDIYEIISKLYCPRYPRPQDERSMALVLLSYCDCYPVTMGEYFDIERLKADFHINTEDYVGLTRAELEILPYTFAVKVLQTQLNEIGDRHFNKIFWDRGLNI